MDNGQQRQFNPSGQSADGFFTPDAGENQINETKNNLDLNSNGAANWGETPDRDQRKIGGNVMASSSEQLAPSAEKEDTELGKIVSLEMPPGHQETDNNPAEGMNATDDAMPTDIAATLNSFRAENDHISRAALDSTEKIINDFEAGKITPAELDNARWDAAKAYQKNSLGLDWGSS